MTWTSDAQPAGVAAGTDADANLRVLATLPLFADVADGELETLARVTRLVEAPAGFRHPDDRHVKLAALHHRL